MVDDEISEIKHGTGEYILNYEDFSITPDPVYEGIYHVTSFIKAIDLCIGNQTRKQNIPIHENVDIKNINPLVVKNIKKELYQEYGQSTFFHLKTQGIKILIRDCEILEQDKVIKFIVRDAKREGIIDGGNLYNIIKNANQDKLNKETYVKISFIIGDFDNDEEFVESLSNKMQTNTYGEIKEDELLWIKEVVDETSYKDRIDELTILSYINIFRNNVYDADVESQPVISYSNKMAVLEMFRENPELFKRYKNILKDILYLYDYVQYKASTLWNSKQGSFGSLGLTAPYKQKGYEYPMLNKDDDYKLHESVVCLLLNGLRYFIIYDSKLNAIWSKDFEDIKVIYDNLSSELIKIIRDYNIQLGGNPHKLGQSNMLYSTIYKEVLMNQILNNNL